MAGSMHTSGRGRNSTSNTQWAQVTSLEDMLRKAGQRSYHDGSEHCVRELKGGIAGLYFLARLWSSPEVLPRSQKPAARLVVYEPAEELFPVLSRVLPEDAELVIVLDYNPTRVLRKRSVLATVPAAEVAHDAGPDAARRQRRIAAAADHQCASISSCPTCVSTA